MIIRGSAVEYGNDDTEGDPHTAIPIGVVQFHVTENTAGRTVGTRYTAPDGLAGTCLLVSITMAERAAKPRKAGDIA